MNDGIVGAFAVATFDKLACSTVNRQFRSFKRLLISHACRLFSDRIQLEGINPVTGQGNSVPILVTGKVDDSLLYRV